MSPKTPPHRLASILAGLLAAASGVTYALDYQLHGFAAQGFVLSGGNNVFGDSTHGSHDYYEAGLSGLLQPTSNLVLSAQGVIRDAGQTDDGRPRLDFALADYAVLQNGAAGAGVRVGRVKNPMGFYNDTRDVVFSRPGIIMPNGVYNDSQNLRALLFSSDGAQVYGRTALGAGHTLSFTGTAAVERKLNHTAKRLLTDLDPLPYDLYLRDFWNAQLRADSDDGAWRTAVSHVHTRVVLETQIDPGDPLYGLGGAIALDLLVFSGNYNLSQLSLTAEYSIQSQRTDLGAGPPLYGSDNGLRRAEGVDVQADWRFAPQWSAMVRYDGSFSDRNDRNGRRAEASGLGDRQWFYAHDAGLGVSWRSAEHWGLWAEYHLVDGSGSVQALDNADHPVPDDSWSYFMTMAAFHF